MRHFCPPLRASGAIGSSDVSIHSPDSGLCLRSMSASENRGFLELPANSINGIKSV
jgi:hypothetical protein